METFELSTDVTNVHEWTYLEGCREFIQGYLDNTKGGTWYYEDNTLVLINKDTQLSRKVFLAGYSTKRDEEDSRGKFGDGLTSGICCLLREGHDIFIENGGLYWQPTLGWSETFDHEIVIIEEGEYQEDNEDYIVKISNLTPEQMNCIVDNTIALQDFSDNKHITPMGDILLDEQHKGRIYCGGLFVDCFKSEYGFDFKPKHFPLDRDRKSVKPFDVKWQTKEMWSFVSKDATEDVADSIISDLVKGEQSLEYTSHTTMTNNKNVRNSAESLYKEKYNGKLVTHDYEEMRELEKAGNKVELVNSESLVKIIKATDTYKTISLSTIKPKTVSETLEDWKQEWYDSFKDDMLYSFEDMQNEIDKL